jgi:hypothetical protein
MFDAPGKESIDAVKDFGGFSIAVSASYGHVKCFL